MDFFSEAQIYHWLYNFGDFQSVNWRGAGRRRGTFPWHPMLLNLVPIFSHPQNTYVETGCKSVVRSPHQMLVGTALHLSGFQQRCLIRWEMDTGFHYDNGYAFKPWYQNSNSYFFGHHTFSVELMRELENLQKYQLNSSSCVIMCPFFVTTCFRKDDQ